MDQSSIPSVFEELSASTSPFEYATPGKRVANLLLDTVAFYLFHYLIYILLGLALIFGGKSEEEVALMVQNPVFGFLLSLFDYVVLFTLMEGISKGRSLGKWITGTVAVKDDLSKIGWKEALLRSFCRLIPFEAFSYFGGNLWHDKLSKTVVIKKRPVGL